MKNEKITIYISIICSRIMAEKQKKSIAQHAKEKSVWVMLAGLLANTGYDKLIAKPADITDKVKVEVQVQVAPILADVNNIKANVSALQASDMAQTKAIEQVQASSGRIETALYNLIK